MSRYRIKLLSNYSVGITLFEWRFGIGQHLIAFVLLYKRPLLKRPIFVKTNFSNQLWLTIAIIFRRKFSNFKSNCNVDSALNSLPAIMAIVSTNQN